MPSQHPLLTDVLDLAHAAPSGLLHAAGHNRSMTRVPPMVGQHTLCDNSQTAGEQKTDAGQLLPHDRHAALTLTHVGFTERL